jgi:hypothetical protein
MRRGENFGVEGVWGDVREVGGKRRLGRRDVAPLSTPLHQAR